MASAANVRAGYGLGGQPYSVHRVFVDGVHLFYREAGDPARPTVILLHGFPSSSHQYRDLIPLLAASYHVLAPDYPGFGFTDVPAARDYIYTFDNLAHTVFEWLNLLKIDSYIPYVFDYGAPVGFRLALHSPPNAIKALITQNGNAYLDGIGPDFAPISEYFANPSDIKLAAGARALTSPEAVKWQYTAGAPDPDAIAPESYTLDSALFARPGVVEAQLALFEDYRTNFAAYPAWQAWLRERKPRVLAVWGARDDIFVPAGARAFQRDVPDAQVELVDGGHFLLESRLREVAEVVMRFLKTCVD